MPQIKKCNPLLAINLFDLDRLDISIRSKLLTGRLELSNHIDMRLDKSKGTDEAALVFKCPLLEAAIICDWIRSHDRSLSQSPTRIYINRMITWKPIPSHTILTEVNEKDKVVLSESVFTGFSFAIYQSSTPIERKPSLIGVPRPKQNG